MIEQVFGIVIADEHLALSMVVCLFVLLLFGYPVALTLGGVGVLFAYLGPDPTILRLLPQRLWGVMNNATLIAVPLFICMGMFLEKSGIAERLLLTTSTLFGRTKAGLSLAVIASGAILAASTGIVGASVVTMGLISLPLMLRRGYSAEFSSGVICASGTLGQIVPPSIVLILLGDIVGVPVGDLFIAAVVPSCLLIVAYAVYALWASARFPFPVAATATPPDSSVGNLELEEATPETIEEAGPVGLWYLLTAFVPPLILIFAVLGSIFAGIASPTEAAAVGAAGAFVLSVLYRRCSLHMLSEVAEQTLHLTCMVFLILLGAQSFGLVFRGLSGDDAIREFVLSFDYGPITFIAITMALLFILGCFLDFIEIIFIVVPIIVPLVAAYQLDMLWFAIVIAINLQMSFLTPPFGFSLFYLKGVAGDSLTTKQIYRGIMPFVVLQILVLGLVVCFPSLATFLPDAINRR